MFAAVASYLDARHHEGSWLVRVEDIDPPREVPRAASSILKSLEAHGLHWDGEAYFQRFSADRHEAAIQQLTDNGALFFCQCARKRLIAAGHQQTYPGICRDLGLDQGATRVRVGNAPITIHDRWQTPLTQRLDQTPGDFIVKRRDGLIAYQLAVVVDDDAQGVTDVVRGIDLYPSTPRQVWLQQLLDIESPRYAHFPVLLQPDGHKLSKQTGAPAIDDLRACENLCTVFTLLGLIPDAPPQARTPEAWLSWAISGWPPSEMLRQTSIPSIL